MIDNRVRKEDKPKVNRKQRVEERKSQGSGTGREYRASEESREGRGNKVVKKDKRAAEDKKSHGERGYKDKKEYGGEKGFKGHKGNKEHGGEQRFKDKKEYGGEQRFKDKKEYGGEQRFKEKKEYGGEQRFKEKKEYGGEQRFKEKKEYGGEQRFKEKKEYGGEQRFKEKKEYRGEKVVKEQKAYRTERGAKENNRKSESSSNISKCTVSRKCGGCQFLDLSYEKQLEQKKKKLEELLKPFCPLKSMTGMDIPYYYRNKVHAVFDHDKKGNPVSGVYEANSHRVVPIESCMIEDQKSDEIIGTIRGMLKSFKIRTFDEDTGYGLLRHVLIRRGFTTGEIMVVLVTASPIFPSKNNFIKALREKHPEITTIIQNVNGRDTSMVLGDKENVLFGKGYIEDILCGCRFRISSKSFYQVNPVQTEVLYKKAIEAAGLTGKERVIDAYCGIGTIGIVASKHVKEVIGVELNRDAVRDAVENAKLNGIKNVRFFCNDAGKFMMDMAEAQEHADVVFLDPPRSGSTTEFIDSVARMRPDKVVYVSCGPETLARDLEYFKKKGYEAKMGWGVDMFPWTGHTEIIVEICRIKK